MSIIKLENISHSYGNKSVLNDLSLNFETNKLTCLLGSSGSGKTTILRLIAGLESPEQGSISIDGKLANDSKLIHTDPHDRNIGFIFQDLALWPHFTVFKNIAFGLSERKEKNIEKTVYEILGFFGLKTEAEKYPHQLSGGQQQLVAISRSLVLKPKILLMDEPLANLDVKLKRKILEHIQNIKQEFNISIVYVTHDHKEAFIIADRIIVLNDGKAEDSGTVEQIKRSENKYVKWFLEY